MELEKITLEEVNMYDHPSYNSNVWPLKFASNGRYILSPTVDGRVFIWNIASRERVGLLADHEKLEIRHILFHPDQKFVLTCGDDTTVRIYYQDTTSSTTVSPVPPLVESQQPTSDPDVKGENLDEAHKSGSSDDEKTDGEDNSSVTSGSSSRHKRKIVKTEKQLEFEASLNDDDDEDYDSEGKKSKRKSSKPKRIAQRRNPF